MSEQETGSNGPQFKLPEQRAERIAQLDAQHKRLNQQWQDFQLEMKPLIGIQGKTPDDIQQAQDKFEDLTRRQNETYVQQIRIEEELFRLLSENP